MSLADFLSALYAVAFFPFIHASSWIVAVPVCCMAVCALFALVRRLMLVMVDR